MGETGQKRQAAACGSTDQQVELVSRFLWADEVWAQAISFPGLGGGSVCQLLAL